MVDKEENLKISNLENEKDKNDDIEQQKMIYINENIIEKGYSPEELSNFIIKNIGIPMESLPFDKLKEMIEEFKNKGLTETYKTIKLNEKKLKENEKEKKKKEIENEAIQKLRSPVFNIYLPTKYQIETKTQQENKLMELHRNNTPIQIYISEPTKEGKKGLFKKKITSYRVQCPQLNSEVKRTLNDFEWFRNQLVIRYPLRLIPPLVKENMVKQIESLLKLENEEYIELRKLRYLQRFIDNVLKRNILKTSPVLYEFLMLDEERFKAYQKKLNSKKYELSISLDNLITSKGKIICELKEDSIQKTNIINKKFSILSDIYNKIYSFTSHIVLDFQNLHSHLNQLSLYFLKLNQYLKEYQCNNCEDMKKVYMNFSNLFNDWSISFQKQSEYFNKDFRETFNYFGLCINEMNTIYKKFPEYKNEYETFFVMINKKKEKLFASKAIEKWGVEPGTEDDIPNYLDNKEVAFSKMLYKESLLLKEEKKRICATIYFINKQFDKLLKNQNQNIKTYYDSIIKNSKDIFGNDQVLNDLLEIK